MRQETLDPVDMYEKIDIPEMGGKIHKKDVM